MTAQRHGGKRQGAGRPALSADQKTTYKTLGVRLSPTFFDRLEELAKEKGISKSEIVREALEKYIEKTF